MPTTLKELATISWTFSDAEEKQVLGQLRVADREGALSDLEADAADLRETAIAIVAEAKKVRFEFAMRRAEEALALAPELKDFLIVEDALRNLPEGFGLHVASTEDPYAEAPDIIDQLETTANFQTVILTTEYAPAGNAGAMKPNRRKLTKLAAALEKAARQGISVQSIFPTPDDDFDTLLVKVMDPDGGTLFDAPGADQLMTWHTRVHDPDLDPNGVMRHSMVGAMGGRRIAVDSESFPAEPVQGDRGGIGVLKCGAIWKPLRREQREKLATLGVNTTREWGEVAPVVADSNRTLHAGDGSDKIYASLVRLRLLLQCLFFKTIEREVMGAGQRIPKLEEARGILQGLLDGLARANWLETSEIVVDYENEDVRMDVRFKSVRPIDALNLSFTEMERQKALGI